MSTSRRSRKNFTHSSTIMCSIILFFSSQCQCKEWWFDWFGWDWDSFGCGNRSLSRTDSQTHSGLLWRCWWKNQVSRRQVRSEETGREAEVELLSGVITASRPKVLQRVSPSLESQYMLMIGNEMNTVHAGLIHEKELPCWSIRAHFTHLNSPILFYFSDTSHANLFTTSQRYAKVKSSSTLMRSSMLSPRWLFQSFSRDSQRLLLIFRSDRPSQFPSFS